jgi:hypothetical protein
MLNRIKGNAQLRIFLKLGIKCFLGESILIFSTTFFKNFKILNEIVIKPSRAKSHGIAVCKFIVKWRHRQNLFEELSGEY